MANNERPAKRQKTEAVQLCPFGKLVPGTDLSRVKFTGRIISSRPYNANTKIAGFSLSSLDDSPAQTKEIHLRGAWAEQASKSFPTNTVVTLFGEGGAFQEMKLKNAETWRQYRIAYSGGIKGSILTPGDDEEDAEPFQFKGGRPGPNNTNNNSANASASSTASSSKTTLSQSTAYLNEVIQNQQPTSSVEARLSPASSSASSEPAPALPSRPATAAQRPRPNTSENPKGTGTRGKKAAKQEAKTTRTEWGITVGKRIYTPLKAVGKGKWSFICIAIESAAPALVAKSLQGDWLTKFKFVDPTLFDVEQPLSISVFGGKGSPLPTVERGSIVIFQQVNRGDKEITYNNVVGYKGTKLFAVLSPDDLIAGKVVPCTTGQAPHARFGQEEIAYALDLAKWWTKHAADVSLSDAQPDDGGTGKKSAKEISLAASRGGGSSRPRLEIKDVEINNFCDVVAEVVKVYKARQSRDPTIIYVTDYTENPELMDYNRTVNRDWPGPYGQRCLQVSAWGAHGETCESDKVKPGSILMLRNIRPKSATGGLLEATMFLDDKRPTQSDVVLLYQHQHPGLLADLLARRKKYWASLKDDAPALPTGDASPRQSTSTSEAINPAASSSRTFVCGLPQTGTDSMLGMLADKTDGAVFKLSGKVISFHPPRLEDWIIAKCPECGDILNSSLVRCPEHDRVNLTFYFHLAISETISPANDYEPPTIWVSIAADEAKDFLPTLLPTQAMRAGESPDIDQLRDALAPLLGTIETAKRHRREPTEEDFGEDFEFGVYRARDREGEFAHVFADMRWVG